LGSRALPGDCLSFLHLRFSRLSGILAKFLQQTEVLWYVICAAKPHKSHTTCLNYK
jgi:hypothetical protein